MYLDREDAGGRLADLLRHYRDASRCIVLGLPRGGVPVAAVVARELNLPLDVLLVRKLGVPGHEEYAMGAIASGGVRVMNEAATALGVTKAEIERVLQIELTELARREIAYRGARAPLRIEGFTVLLIDDGLATGASMRAGVAAARAMGAARVVVAVPVASADACTALRNEADEVVCASVPAHFMAVSAWYRDFPQLSDGEVIDALEAHGPV